MKRFALIGHPVEGSLSPVLFRAAYNGRYAYDLIDAPFQEAWGRFLSSYHGINVTAPYKQDAFARADVLAPGARLTGAVNLAVKEADGLIHGYNTDIDGVVGAVHECGLPMSFALVVGAGGAARAAVVAAGMLGCKDVFVANRTFSKAQALADDFGCTAVQLSDIHTLSPDLIIYTVPGGVGAQLLSPELLAGVVALEAEYKHPSLASMPCRAYISGRRWLLHQAIAGYRLFTGEDPDSTAMAAAL